MVVVAVAVVVEAGRGGACGQEAVSQKNKINYFLECLPGSVYITDIKLVMRRASPPWMRRCDG